MMFTNLLKKVGILLLTVGFIALSLPSSGLAEEDDYSFYKKHGHSKKAWNEAVKMGFAAYDQQDCDSAIKYLKEAVGMQCQDALVYFKLAVCTEVTGSPYTAMQFYQLAQEKLQQLPAVHRYQKEIFENYGRSLYKAKKYKEALPYLTRAAAVGTPSFGLFYLVGSLYAKNNDWPAALDYWRRALTQDTSGVDPKILSDVYYEVAKAYYQNKDFKTANTLLDKAIKLNPENKEAQKLKGFVATGLQQLSIVEMIQGLSDKQTKKEPVPRSLPPPPAASKLPPLDGQSDPTPPLGTPQTPQAPQTPPSSQEGTPTQLAPLPK